MEAEVFLALMKNLKLADGRDRLVRHGHGPERSIETGIGAVTVSRVKIRDRETATEERVRLTSAIFPLWARRTKSLDALLPVLYCAGYRPATFKRHSRHCWAQTRRTVALGDLAADGDW